MDSPLTSREILEREFLPTRAKILEIAATFDRISRSNNETDDPRLSQLQEAIEMLLEPRENRAERVQLHFSQRYDEDWRENLAVK